MGEVPEGEIRCHKLLADVAAGPMCADLLINLSSRIETTCTLVCFTRGSTAYFNGGIKSNRRDP